MKQYLLILLILTTAASAMAQSHISDLVVTPASGGTIKWYDASTNGTQYTTPATTVLVTGTTYYASQTVNGVESTARLAVTATDSSQPQGSITANGPFCTDGTGQLTWTATAGTGPYTVRYTDGYGDRTAIGVVSGTPFNVYRSISVAEGSQYYTLVSVQDATCTRTSGFTGGSAILLAGFPPTLNGASQATTVCDGSSAIINLTGLIDNKTFTVDYKINGVAQTPVTGVTIGNGDQASFTTAALVAANNGQILQITGLTITTPATGCNATFTQNVTLSVNSITAPVSLSHNGTRWEWSSVVGATGYRWSSTDNYESAVDVGNVLFVAQCGGIEATAYVWAYNSVCHSAAKVLTTFILDCPN